MVFHGFLILFGLLVGVWFGLGSAGLGWLMLLLYFFVNCGVGMHHLNPMDITIKRTIF
jgi:hypothetical protein